MITTSQDVEMTPSSGNPIPALADPIEAVGALVNQTGDGLLALYLDFDGTIAELVDHHDDARPYEGAIDCIVELRKHCRIAIVSGRNPEDVKARLGIEDMAYAGNHGLRIIRPDGGLFEVHFEGEEALHAVDRDMQTLVGEFEGAGLERKATSRVLHYRKVEAGDHERIVERLEDLVARYPDLEIKHGKMVREVQPRIHWHKGFAVRWLNEHAGEPIGFTLFVGDDVTDEDAFEMLGDAESQMPGCGILVAERPRPTSARYRLDGVPCVKRFMEALLRELSGRESGLAAKGD
jgi:trehalose-phosphatase